MILKQTPLKKVSDKQAKDLALRRKIKYELYVDQDGKCAECGKFLNWYEPTSDAYPNLSHKIPLSQGGKTDKINCKVKCGECHSNINHRLNNKYNEHPAWRY